jgi:putative aldouronate transport system substrate-binding protein
MKKLASVLLSLCLLCSFLAGCGGTTASTTSSAAESTDQTSEAEEKTEAASQPETPDEAPAEASEAEAEEESVQETADLQPTPVDLPICDSPTTYSIWYNEPFTEFVDDPAQDVALFGYLADTTNIQFEFQLTTVDTASEKFQLLFAASDLPDVITDAMEYYTGSIDDAVEQDDFLYEYSGDLASMPNYAYTLSQYPEAKKTITSSTTGNMVAFPEIYLDVGDVSGYMMRKDYLDATGLDIPQTYDELYAVLTAIHEATGTSMELISSGGDGLLGNGFGINVTLSDSDIDSWYVEDGEVKLGLLQPEYKDYLELVSKWYSEGLIDPDFMNSDRGDLSGLFTGKLNTTVKPPEIIAVAQTVIGVEMVTVPMPRQNADDELHACGAATSCLMDGNAWSINAAVEDVEPLLQFVDYLYSEDGNQLVNYGIEGVTYEMVDGAPQFTDLITNNADGLEFIQAAYLYASCNRTRLPFLSDYSRCFVMYTDEEWNAVETYSYDCDHEKDYPLGAIMTTDQNRQYNTVSADIATYISENVLQFIIGQKSLDEWDSFVSTLYDMGIETAIEVKQAAYDDYLAS